LNLGVVAVNGLANQQTVGVAASPHYEHIPSFIPNSPALFFCDTRTQALLLSYLKNPLPKDKFCFKLQKTV